MDSGARGRGFDPHSGHRVVSLSKTHLPPKSTGNTQEEGLRPNMTEKLFTGTLRIKSTNQPTRWDAAFCSVTSGAIVFTYVPEKDTGLRHGIMYS